MIHIRPLPRRILKGATFGALTIAILAAIPAQSFADSPLAKLYKTNPKEARNSARFPRARYEKGNDKYVWGDMQLDVRPGETIECSAHVTNAKTTKCFYTPSDNNFNDFTASETDINSEVEYNSKADAVKVGWKATYAASVRDEDKEINEAFGELDLTQGNEPNISVKDKTGRLWAYVWDFNTSWKTDSDLNTDGKVGVVGKSLDAKGNVTVNPKDYLNTSFYANVPNGNPVEIKLDNVSGDAFSLAGYQTLLSDRANITSSIKWNESTWENYNDYSNHTKLYSPQNASFFFNNYAQTSIPDTAKSFSSIHATLDRDNFIYEYLQQGPCDGDNWGKFNKDSYSSYSRAINYLPIDNPPEHYTFYYSGEDKQSKKTGSYDNYARQCLEQFKGALSSASSNIEKTPLYLEKPDFSSSPKMTLGNVIVTPVGTSDDCVFPMLEGWSSGENLKIKGLGAVPGKGQLVCVNSEEPTIKKVAIFDIDENGQALTQIGIDKEGKYNCYVERVNQFNIAFADAEQVGALRMYEVAPTGERIPLTLGWDDRNLDKNSILVPNPQNQSETINLPDLDIFRLPSDKQSPKTAKNVISANHDVDYDASTDNIKCSGDVNARCWGDYEYSGDHKFDTNKFGIGNGDIVLTWTYYPTSDRFAFTLIAVDPSLYSIQAPSLSHECSSGIEPATKSKPIDSDHDGIPDVVEGRPGIKIDSKGGEIPGTDTDGDGNPNYNDNDSDGDGIPDKVECHFNASHTGYGFVNGCEDTDHDGIPDYKDTDSDNDGVPDRSECDYQNIDDGAHRLEGCKVKDPATKYVPDYRNPDVKGGKPGEDGKDDKIGDADGDGIPDKIENDGADPTKANDGKHDKDGNVDSDNDGIPDYQDPDSDNDGIPDKVENKGADHDKARQSGYDKHGNVDTDGDGIPDYQDPDSDGDGKNDKEECVYDKNNVGVNYIDGCVSSNDKGVPDYKDGGKKNQKEGEDNNHDGLPDKIEKDTTHTGDDADDDKDGIPNSVECPGYKNETDPRVGPLVNGCPDTDGDGVPDYQDPDSDGDGIPDKVENDGADSSKAGQSGYDKHGNVDTDNDGTPDYKDPDSDGDGIPDKVENDGADSSKAGQSGYDNHGNVDTDNDGTPDYKDPNSDGDGIDDKDECHYDSTAKGANIIKGCVVSPGNTSGKPDYQDPDTHNDNTSAGGGKGDDTDGDGIPDKAEGRDYGNDKNSTDSDGDGTPDYKDTDSDGDGVPDKVECPDWNPLHVGKHYVNGCPATNGDKADNDDNRKPDYQVPDSNGDGTNDGQQCDYDASTQKCKIEPFGEGGYRHRGATPVDPQDQDGSALAKGLIAGGCGCASTPDGGVPAGELLLVGLLAGGAVISRRRRKDD